MVIEPRMNEFLDSIFLYTDILAVAHTGIPASEHT